MQTATIMLALGGDSGNTVQKRDVTPAEVAVLRAIHGNEAVFDVEPTADIQRSNREDLRRVRQTYGAARDAENNAIVDILYPGAAARVFENFDELDLPAEMFKPMTRATSETKAAPAPSKPLFAGKGDHDKNGEVGGAAPPQPPEEGLAAKTVAELKAIAAERNIDLGEATKKADIIAKLEATVPEETFEEPVVDEEVDDDGIEDMPSDDKSALFK